MRKFKLIKEFPLSPVKGTIATFKTMEEEIEGIYDMGAIPNLILTDCTQFPEFWEEVKEQEFEILEFTAQVTGLKHVLREDGKYNPNGLSKETLLEHSVLPLQITKIKRLFNDEDFSIGDRVIIDECSPSYSKGFIKYFQVASDGHVRVEVSNGCNVGLQMIKKAPEPLFVTEDNVEIFEGDNYWFYWTKNPASMQYVNIPYEVFNAKKLDRDSVYSHSAKFFSTKEAAEKYIDENKPKYSKKEIKEALSKVYLSTTNGTFINEGLFRQCLGL